MTPCYGPMLPISSLTPFLSPAPLLMPSILATQLPQCSQNMPGTLCLEATFQLPSRPRMVDSYLAKPWHYPSRFDFSRIVITDPQLPSNFAR